MSPIDDEPIIWKDVPCSPDSIRNVMNAAVFGARAVAMEKTR